MDKYFTVVHVMSSDGDISAQDIERWREIFANNPEKLEKFDESGEVFVEKIPILEDSQYITLVKVGNDKHQPSVEDLEAWRKVFEEAGKDPDFKIFTHSAVQIEVINIGKIVAVD